MMAEAGADGGGLGTVEAGEDPPLGGATCPDEVGARFSSVPAKAVALRVRP
jgi:hypothetical protein